MKERTIRMLIKIVEESKIDELEISRWGRKIRICKTNLNNAPPKTQVTSPQAVGTTFASSEVETPKPALAPSANDEGVAGTVANDAIEIKSPMVGTFYRRPAPEAEPYVEVGDIISPGKVLCIIEAMKLMNEIESEVSGKIKNILVENAQPVEYNQTLFQVQKL